MMQNNQEYNSVKDTSVFCEACHHEKVCKAKLTFAQACVDATPTKEFRFQYGEWVELMIVCKIYMGKDFTRFPETIRL